MNKLSLAAIVTATLGGAGAVAITVTRGDDAHARSTQSDQLAAARAVSHDEARRTGARRANASSSSSAARLPALLGLPPTRSATIGLEDKSCAAVAKYLQELEADTTHGPDHRPDDETADQCASHFQTRCETDGWSEELRDCMLAATDLINAHMCTSGVTGAKPSDVPPALACTKLGPQIAAIVQAAGFHSDVTDLGPQIVASCETGNWPTPLRQCLATGDSIAAFQACIEPH